MRKNLVCLLAATLLAIQAYAQPAISNKLPFFPPPGKWPEKIPADLGMQATLLMQAVELAQKNETRNPRSMEENHYRTFGREPFGEAIGPFSDRGEQTGVVIYKGYCVAQWGEPDRCDMSHSITKSFLSAIVGMGVAEGLIADYNDPVHHYIPPIEPYQPGIVQRPAEALGTPALLLPFQSAHNRQITWEHLLRQTSAWQGTLWGKPDWADRPDKDPATWLKADRPTPGTVFEYNDVRVNALALAATSVWRKPLPEVLKDRLMDPIGASNTWRWTGYRNAWIVLDGKPIQSVSGGGHWGGGMFINAWDMARFGYLTMHKGNWNGKTLLPGDFFKRALTPTEANREYGFMNYFLNTDKKLLPSAPATAWYHLGNGANIIYVDPENNLVAVFRWMDQSALDSIIKLLIASLPDI